MDLKRAMNVATIGAAATVGSTALLGVTLSKIPDAPKKVRMDPIFNTIKVSDLRNFKNG